MSRLTSETAKEWGCLIAYIYKLIMGELSPVPWVSLGLPRGCPWDTPNVPNEKSTRDQGKILAVSWYVVMDTFTP